MTVADRAGLLAMGVAALLLATPARGEPAGGTSPGTGNAAVAESLFRAGVAAFDAGRTDEACDAFVESYRLDPANGTLLDVALCHERQGKTASAWAELSLLAGRAAQAGQKDREQMARVRAATLERHLSRVQLVIPVDAGVAEVHVDGQSLGRAAWGSPLPVDPGEHTFDFASPDRVAARVTVTVPPEALTRVVAPALAPVPAAAVDRAPRPQPDDRTSTGGAAGSGTRRALAYVAGGLGVVALGAGTYFGLRTLAKKSDAEAHCMGRFCDDAGLALEDQAHASATASTVAFALGLGGVAAFAVLYLTSSSAPEPASRSALRVVPSATAGGGGLRLEGRF